MDGVVKTNAAHCQMAKIIIVVGFYHFNMLSLQYDITPTRYHFNMISLQHVITSIWYHSNMLSLQYDITPTRYHFNMISLQHVITPTCYHFNMISLQHVIIAFVVCLDSYEMLTYHLLCLPSPQPQTSAKWPSVPPREAMSTITGEHTVVMRARCGV